MAQRTDQHAANTYSRVTSVVTKEDGQATKSNVKVVVRIRPENRAERSGNYGTSVQVLDEQVLVFDPKEEGSPDFFHGKKRRGRDITKRKAKDVKFAFDRVFDGDSSNREVYNNTTRCILNGLLDGYNCSVFAYGATGAGKTFTMLGNLDNPGVVFFTMMDLYTHIGEIKEDKTCEVAVSYMEVYNEQIRDLLMPGAFLPVREDPSKGAIVTGLSLHKPGTAEELMHMLAFGNKNRTQHPTDANAESSRSHAVFQVFVRQRDRTANISADVKVAKMSLIDLAGSERATVTTNRGARFREGANINRSLLALGNCINALAEGKAQGYVPYRNSKLTRLLKDSLGGNCQTVMIAAISPSNMTYEDTHNTLKYANRAKNIKANLKRNMLSVDFHVSKYAKICDDLREEVAELRLKLKQYEEGAILNVNKTSVLPSSRQLEVERVQGEVYRVFLDRTGIRKELMELEGSERDIIFRIHSRRRSLTRITTMYSDPSESNKVTSRLERSITAALKRLNGIKSRKEGIVRRMCDNSEWLAKVESSVQELGKTGELPQVLVSCIKNSNVEVELRDTRRQVKFLKKICRVQERDALSSEKLISTLLHTVKRQYYLLVAHGLATSDVTTEFEGVRQAVSGDKEVVWADQSVVSCDPTHDLPEATEGCTDFNINQLLDFPVLVSGCMTPQTPHGRLLVQYATTPMTCGKTPLSVSKHTNDGQTPAIRSQAVDKVFQTLQVPTPKSNHCVRELSNDYQSGSVAHQNTSTLANVLPQSQNSVSSQATALPQSQNHASSQATALPQGQNHDSSPATALPQSLKHASSQATSLPHGQNHASSQATAVQQSQNAAISQAPTLPQKQNPASYHPPVLPQSPWPSHSNCTLPVSDQARKSVVSAIQFGSQTVTIDPAISMLISNTNPGPHIPVHTDNAQSLTPCTTVSRTPSYSMKQAGSLCGNSEALSVNDTFTMEGVYPLQLSPSGMEIGAAAACLTPVLTGTTGDGVIYPAQVLTSIANHPTGQRPVEAGKTEVTQKKITVTQPTVNTATVTKNRPEVLSGGKLAVPINKTVSRVIEFTGNSNTGPKSFAEAVKSPASMFSRSPLMSRENLPQFTPTGKINHLPDGDIRRMTFAANEGPRQKLFRAHPGPADQGGPVRRQTISAAEAKRMEVLHSMGLPSVTERHLGRPGPRRQALSQQGGQNSSQSQPRYMQLTQAASRRHQSHHRSPTNENDENRKPRNGAQRIAIEEKKKGKSHRAPMRSNSTALHRQRRFNVF